MQAKTFINFSPSCHSPLPVAVVTSQFDHFSFLIVKSAVIRLSGALRSRGKSVLSLSVRGSFFLFFHSPSYTATFLSHFVTSLGGKKTKQPQLFDRVGVEEALECSEKKSLAAPPSVQSARAWPSERGREREMEAVERVAPCLNPLAIDPPAWQEMRIDSRRNPASRAARRDLPSSTHGQPP